MSTWTINGGALDDLAVDTIVFSVANQEEDYAEIRFDAAYDAALPSMFQVGAPVIIRYGSQIVFQGEIDNPSFHGAGSIEYQSVFVFGPWHRFAQMPFLYMYPYVTGDALSTHGVIGGDANALLTAILTTNGGDFFQVGTIDVGTITIPESEVYDQTLSQVIQAILRFIPGAQVIFDYATTPPTCHILADNSTGLETVALNPADGLTSNLNLTPLYNRLADGVTLQYEASGATEVGEQLRTQNYAGELDTVSSPASSSGFFILGTDSAGDAQSRRHFRRTIRLEGAYDVSVYTLYGQLWPYTPLRSVRGGPFTMEDLLAFSAESGTTRNNKLLMVDRAMFFRMMWDGASGFSFDLDVSIRASAENAGVLVVDSEGWISAAVSGALQRNFRPLMRVGGPQSTTPYLINPLTNPSYCKWHRHSLSTQFLKTVDVAGIVAYGMSHLWSFTNTSGVQGGAGQAGGDENHVVFLDKTTLGSINESTGRFTYVKTVNNTSAVWPGPGIAAQILAANSRLLWEGGCTVLLEDDPTRFFGLARKATIASLSASTVIQRFTLDVATGLCDLTFGAPTHLGPQDLITLLRAGGAA